MEAPIAVAATALNITFMGPVVTVIALAVSSAWYLKKRVYFVGKDEQLFVEHLTDLEVLDGPRTVLLPIMMRSAKLTRAIPLGALDYVVVKNTLSGLKRIEKGPKLLFLKPFDKTFPSNTKTDRKQALSLKANEYVRFLDEATGQIRIIRGEQGMVYPDINEVVIKGISGNSKEEAIDLKAHQFIKIEDKLTAQVRVEKGEKLIFLNPYEEVVGEGKRNAIELKANEFCKINDQQTGAIRVERGEKLVFLGPFEEVDDKGKRKAFDLKAYEYVRLEDKKTGEVRVEKGEQLVFLNPHEEKLGGGAKEKAVEIDEETSVLIRNKRTGQQYLNTNKGIFIPAKDEEILDVRKLIKLADYETCIIRGKDGHDEFYYGSNVNQRSFFLPPHSELVQLCWSRGRRREHRDLIITKFDTRPQYMSFEFNCRTSDNVELILEGSFFWEVVDFKKMFTMTSDTSGDVCNHARSKFIERVSRVTLREFMSDFNKIAHQVHEQDGLFYEQRGVSIHSLEVTGYRCADDSTAAVLAEIIVETTNRMNRLQKQESENEVRLYEMRGEIEQEKARSELLDIRTHNSNKQAAMRGLAEGEKLKAFLDHTQSLIPDLLNRIDIWKVLRKTDMLDVVSKGNAKLFFTPNQCNISIEAHDQDERSNVMMTNKMRHNKCDDSDTDGYERP
eukprot:GHVN01103886.1.p1 GENE.GHVN01103886.1~~GHVN01103886.1.p1  ORF type:complete len:672 (+),score=146.59 GHVN01103886.1:249-2264(+)